MMSQSERLAYKIELRIQTDNEDFMHDTNQYEFKMDGERRVSRGYASDGLGEQRNRYGSKAGDPRVMESSMLKSVIIQVKKVTCESSWISLLCKSKIQSH